MDGLCSAALVGLTPGLCHLARSKPPRLRNQKVPLPGLSRVASNRVSVHVDLFPTRCCTTTPATRTTHTANPLDRCQLCGPQIQPQRSERQRHHSYTLLRHGGSFLYWSTGPSRQRVHRHPHDVCKAARVARARRFTARRRRQRQLSTLGVRNAAPRHHRGQQSKACGIDAGCTSAPCCQTSNNSLRAWEPRCKSQAVGLAQPPLSAGKDAA